MVSLQRWNFFRLKAENMMDIKMFGFGVEFVVWNRIFDTKQVHIDVSVQVFSFA